MTRNLWLKAALGVIGLALLLLIFWGWRQAGIELFQLGMSQC